MILGAGIGGSHSAYRLAPIHGNHLCIFERENYVGGRAHDADFHGNSTEAYATTPIAPTGAIRFFGTQPVVKQLVDELNISYYQYDYQTFVIKARGKLYNSYNEMCAKSYVDLNCTDDINGLNAQDQLLARLLAEYQKNASNLYRFANFNAFSRSILGDEATEYLKDSYRFRGDFLNVDTYSFLEYSTQEWNLMGPLYYPHEGLSQIVKRMISKATSSNHARLYLNEEVLQINENTNTDYTFSIETSNYQVYGQQLVAGIDPASWPSIQGTIANEIKSNEHFQSILPIKTIVINNYWPERWWEQNSSLGLNIDRAWTRQNCISFIEILSQQPEKREQNLTRTVYDDGACIDTWSTLIQRSSQEDLIEELLRGLRTIFIDMQIPRPTKTFSYIWSAAWHYQKSNSHVTNKQIIRWATKPIARFGKHQLSLVGDGFYIDRPGWIDGAIKSSLISLHSQFNFTNMCYSNDAAVKGTFCTGDFIEFSQKKNEL